jgi:hypothetical protein
MSGYAANVLAERGVVDAPALLQKPFSALALMTAVRQALDASTPAPS